MASLLRFGNYLGLYLGPCGNVNCCGLQPREVENFEYSSQGEMTLFPNPAHNLLNIQLPSFASFPIRINVYNNLGQVLLSNLVTSFGINQTVISLDIESIPGGYYFLSVSSNMYKEIKSFTKIK